MQDTGSSSLSSSDPARPMFRFTCAERDRCKQKSGVGVGHLAHHPCWSGLAIVARGLFGEKEIPMWTARVEGRPLVPTLRPQFRHQTLLTAHHYSTVGLQRGGENQKKSR